MIYENESYDFLFKALLLGEIAVGKTSMILRYVQNRFPGEYQATIGANFLVKVLQIPNPVKKSSTPIKVALQLWDLGGHVRRASMVGRIFYQGVSGVFLVYDVTREDTLYKLPLWVKEYKKYSPNAYSILVGNKIDLTEDRKLSFEDGEKYKQELGASLFFETSAKTGEHVKEAFETFAKFLVERSYKKMEETNT